MNRFKKIFTKYKNLYSSMFYKRDKNLMIFGAWMGKKYDDNSRFLFEYVVRERTDITAVWITQSVDTLERLQNMKLPVCLAGTDESKNLAKHAKYVFTVTGILDIEEKESEYIGGAYHINLWHGIPLKKIMYDDEYSTAKSTITENLKAALKSIPLNKHYIISTSDEITKIYTSAFRKSENYILQLGQPRNDLFFVNHRNPYRDRFQGKRIVLYMPTHRNEGKKKMNLNILFDFDDLDRWCKRNNAVFIIKKHFYHSEENDLKKSYSSITDITNDVAESQMLLDAADVLITDYSSCYIDYLLLDRPILFFNFDIEEYMRIDRRMYFDYSKVTPGLKCDNYKQLIDGLSMVINGQDEYEKSRENIKNFFFSKNNQGIVSPHLIDEIIKLK